jgi:hypothetical protein
MTSGSFGLRYCQAQTSAMATQPPKSRMDCVVRSSFKGGQPVRRPALDESKFGQDCLESSLERCAYGLSRRVSRSTSFRKTPRALLRTAVPGGWANLLLILPHIPWAGLSALHDGIVRIALSICRGRVISVGHTLICTRPYAHEQCSSEGHEYFHPEYHACSLRALILL